MISTQFCKIFLCALLTVLLSVSLTAQVTFTQSSDADFNQGHLNNVQVSGGNVYLSTAADGISNWLSTNDLPEILEGHKTCLWKSYVYLSGGHNGSEYSNRVYRATLQSSGNSTWTSYGTMPESLKDHAMITGHDFIYVIGGKTETGVSDKIYFAKINSDGTLGAWSESQEVLPSGLWGHTAAYLNGFIYVVGGTDQLIMPAANNNVYFTRQQSMDGSIEAFQNGIDLPGNISFHGMACYNNSLVITGGFDETGVKQDAVVYSMIDTYGNMSAWTAANNLPTALSNHGMVCNHGMFVLIGGEDNTGLSKKIYYTGSEDFTALTWTLSTDTLYLARKNGSAYFSHGQVIYSGGENISTSPVLNTRYAALSLTGNKVHHGDFLSGPFLQLGAERTIANLTYNINYNLTYNNYELNYRLAGADQMWGTWTAANQDNPANINATAQYLQYLIIFDGTDDDNLVLNDMSINISGYTQLSGNLNGIDTLKLENSPYWVTGDISFTGGTHVIEAGVNILFSANTGLEIGQAYMEFAGTSSAPIILTSYSGEPDVWNGVFFNSSSDNGVSSSMQYVTIEKAGNGSRNANMYCENTNEPLIENCTFRLAGGQGLKLNNANLVVESTQFDQNSDNGVYNQNSSPTFIDCNFTNNSISAIRIADGSSNPNYSNCVFNNNQYGLYYSTPNYSFPTITGITTYSNIISGIAMDGGDVTSNQNWPYNPMGYAVLGSVKIVKQNSKVRLTIAPGNTIYFDTLVQLQIGNYIHYLQDYGGELYAVGTPDSVITFTSVNGQPGGWNGLYFHYNSDSFTSESTLTNCIIENGNQSNIRIDQSLQPVIDSCTINNALTYDILVYDPNSVPMITNSITEVFVMGGTQSINKTWHNYGNSVYNILTDYVIGKKNSTCRLTIEPGVTVKIDTSATLQIGQYVYYLNEYGGEIYAEGTADSIITFTSRNGLAGGWDGMFFHYNSDSFGSTSSLKYCDISNGSGYNIRSDGSAEPRIDNCTITGSEGYDVYATAPNDVQHITNTTTTVYVGTGTQSINKTWHNFGGGNYVIAGNMFIGKKNDTCRLTIEPGITVLADTTVGIQVAKYVHYLNEYGGEIHAIGNADSIITFNSLNGQQGGWEGIFFHYNSDSFGSNSIFDYCHIENGNAYNIRCENTVEPRIDNSTIINALGYDIHAMNPNSVPPVTNTNSTVYVEGGTQSINKTWYYFGGDYIVLSPVIIGKQNSYRTLTIQPGTIIKFDTDARIQVGNYVHYLQHYGGELIANGTMDSLIIFQPWDNIPGGWLGFYFHENADNYGGMSSFKNCIIEGATTNNINAHRTNNIYFDHVTISNSGENGLYLNESSPHVRLCQIINNDSTGIKLVNNSHPVVGDTLGLGCDFYGNGKFAIINNTSQFINAKHNFWNETDSAAISWRIYDYYENTSYGIVDYMPYAPASLFYNHPPDEFNLLSLANNSATANQTPSFTWEVPTDPNADAVSYYFYYTTDSTWASDIHTSVLLSNNNYTIPDILSGGTSYWWRVKATDGYLSRYSSETWKFVCSLPPTIPVLAVPSNGSNLRGNDFLVWFLSSDPDNGDYVDHYRIQLDDDPAFGSPEIDMDNISTNSKSSSITMQISELTGYENLENKVYYWRVRATDGYGISSDYSDGTNHFQYLLDVQLKVFLEGPYADPEMHTSLNVLGMLPLSQPYNTAPWNYFEYDAVQSMPANAVDWILLELRNSTGDAATATNVLYRKACLLMKDGQIANTDGTTNLEFPVSFDDNVYVVVYHRNHVPVIAEIPLTVSGGIYLYDFSTGDDKVLGGTDGYASLDAGVWGMAAGDSDANGTVEGVDKSVNWETDAGNTGYLNTDLNMDGQTNNPDKNDMWLKNLGKYDSVPE